MPAPALLVGDELELWDEGLEVELAEFDSGVNGHELA